MEIWGGMNINIILDATSKRGTAMATVVSDWIDRYNENKEAAALELVNYIIEVN